MKVRPSYHVGQEFISLATLPYDQYVRLIDWLPITSLKTIFIEGQELQDCVAYEEYDYWFENFYKQAEEEFDFDI